MSAFDGLSLFRLHVLVSVVDHGGYAAAARVLDIAQPTVVFHVQALQDVYQTRLLQFVERQVVLTPAGEAVYRSAQVMLRDARNLERIVRDVREGQIGHLRLGASMAFELPIFFDFVLGPFREAHPRVRISIEFGQSIPLAEQVRDRSLDAAYVLSWDFPKGVHQETLHGAEFVYVVAPHHPLARQEMVTAAEVAEAGLIAAPIDGLEWRNYASLLHATGMREPRVTVEIDGFQARLLAARAGWGVLGMFVPSYARDSPLTGLKRLRLEVPSPRAEFSLVTIQRALWTPLLANFAAWLRNVTA